MPTRILKWDASLRNQEGFRGKAQLREKLSNLEFYQLASDYMTHIGDVVRILMNPKIASSTKRNIVRANDAGIKALKEIGENRD